MHAEGTPRRRTAVKGRRGIYYRVGADGRRRYEITYRDSASVRRWKTIHGSLEDAQAALDDVRARLHRGERIAPTKVTLAEYTPTWLATQTQLRPRTRELYEGNLRAHVLPRIGQLRVGEVTEDDVAQIVSEMQTQGYAGWTIQGVLTPLGRVLGHAARRGLIASNPVHRLERAERPRVGGRPLRVLDADEIDRLIAAASPTYRPAIVTAVFTGLRIGELLGLVWRDIDFDAGIIRVEKQLDRKGNRVDPKTRHAVREVVLMPALGRLLRQHRLASRASLGTDPVFSSTVGSPLHFRNLARRGLDRAAADAGLDSPGQPKLRFHDLRHAFASLLISEGLNVVFVSRQLGHASPDITLKTYAHLFDRQEHAERATTAMERRFGIALGND